MAPLGERLKLHRRGTTTCNFMHSLRGQTPRIEEGPAAWKLDTTIADLERSAAQAQDEKTRQELREIIAALRALL